MRFANNSIEIQFHVLTFFYSNNLIKDSMSSNTFYRFRTYIFYYFVIITENK